MSWYSSAQLPLPPPVIRNVFVPSAAGLVESPVGAVMTLPLPTVLQSVRLLRKSLF